MKRTDLQHSFARTRQPFLVPGPVEFRMGSPLSEPGRFDSEVPHRRRIGRNFALASRPVTVEQFQRFCQERRDVRPVREVKDYAPEAGCPIIGVTWFEAAQYCNWLSAKEGLPETEWCYPSHAAIKEGMKPYPDYLKCKGYRLPTEAEWEYAARAGASSSYSFGSSVELLPRYAWYLHNSSERSWPVGQKRPNDLGLFDSHGNVFTWCQNVLADYPAGKPAEDKEDIIQIEDRYSRLLRGGSFLNQPREVRSAVRDNNRPSNRNLTFGLRPARTYD
jgi:formylglycine-generating enzyme required for sulfatase activity